MTGISTFDSASGDFFRMLYNEQQGRVYAVAFSITCNREDAEEVLQDTFFCIWRSIDRFAGLSGEETSAMVARYARNRAIDLLRKRKRRVNTMPLSFDNDGCISQELPDESLNPEKILFSRLKLRELSELVETLPDGQRKVIRLKYGGGMSNPEIAERLRVSVGAVKSRLCRAKFALLGCEVIWNN